MKLRLLTVLLLCLTVSAGEAQEKSKIKFGKVAPEDFQNSVYSLDSSANAVIIADIGSTEIVGNTKGSFSLEFKNYRRARILNKNGYDIADVEINIYTDGKAEEELSNLKAVTYNLENGKVVETKLEAKSIFKDKISKNLVIKKFTFPNIKEGSIIEYEYKVRSDFMFNLQPWVFQGAYPRLWSEYNVSMPEFYYYVTLSQGYQSFFIKDQKERRESYTVVDNGTVGQSDRSTFTAGVTDYRWVMKNVPAMKEESYTSTIQNHISKIEFQLAELRQPFIPKNIMGTWKQVAEELLKDEDFGYSLDRDNGWLDDAMQQAVKGGKGLDKAKAIYAYVRDNMTCTNYNRKYLDKPLKSILKDRNGNEAEINLLLTAMLRKGGFNAYPVMLSTRSHGYSYPLYPLLDRFNYVITQLNVDGAIYYLDASHARLGFGHLGTECYNGHARIIDAEATAIDLVPDSLLERKLCSVFIINDGKGNLSGSVQQISGYVESYELRNRIKDKGQEQLFSDIKKGFNADIEIKEPAVDSLNRYDDVLGIRYQFDLKSDKEDIIYVNPMFGEAWKENPFKSANRLYPVEMSYLIDETYLLKLDVPDGYEVDELPKQVVVKMNEEDDGNFEYRLSVANNSISLRSRIRLKRSYFMPEEYEMLREFFNLIVQKHSEQIVFKKKK